MHADESTSTREIVLSATRALVGLAARSLTDVSDDVSLAQYRVLVLLDGRGPQTMGALAESLDVNSSTVTRVCDRLVEKDLVARRTDDEDRRAVRVDLTSRGRRLVGHVMERRRRLIDEVLARLSSESQRRVARAFSEFAAAAGELSDAAWALGWPPATVAGPI